MNESTRQYSALNGLEIIDYACAELRREMEHSGQFPLHRVFHEMSFVGGIRVSGWGTVPAQVKFATEGNGEGHPEDAEALDIKLKIEAQPEPPSLVRERLAAETVAISEVNDASKFPKQSETVMRVSDNDESIGVYHDTEGSHVVPEHTSPAVMERIDEQQQQIQADEVAENAVALTCSVGCDFVAKSYAGRLAHERHCKGHPDVTD